MRVGHGWKEWFPLFSGVSSHTRASSGDVPLSAPNHVACVCSLFFSKIGQEKTGEERRGQERTGEERRGQDTRSWARVRGCSRCRSAGVVCRFGHSSSVYTCTDGLPTSAEPLSRCNRKPDRPLHLRIDSENCVPGRVRNARVIGAWPGDRSFWFTVQIWV